MQHWCQAPMRQRYVVDDMIMNPRTIAPGGITDKSIEGVAMIAERYTDYMYNLIDKVMKDIGPRESCGEEEKQLGRLFAREIEPACGRVETEAFTCSPTAFLGFFPYLVLMFVAGVVLYFFLPPFSQALAVTGGAVLFFEVVRYKEFIDPVYPKKEGENLSLIHISEPTRLGMISYAVFCLKKKKKKKKQRR